MHGRVMATRVCMVVWSRKGLGFGEADNLAFVGWLREKMGKTRATQEIPLNQHLGNPWPCAASMGRGGWRYLSISTLATHGRAQPRWEGVGPTAPEWQSSSKSAAASLRVGVCALHGRRGAVRKGGYGAQLPKREMEKNYVFPPS
jgi:hypothetical protein